MHALVAIDTPDDEGEDAGWHTELYEVSRFRPPPSVVDQTLSICGFGGGAQSAGIDVRAVDPDEVNVVRVVGFDIPAQYLSPVRAAVERGLTGETGGFAPVVAGLVGFHFSFPVFRAAWAAAGRPPCRVYTPRFADGREADDRAPRAVGGPRDHAILAAMVRSRLRVPQEDDPGDA
ncbi:MAG: hypothetical protein AAGN82_31265 [Myxococcota bacterium]